MDESYIKDNLDRYFILFVEKELEKDKIKCQLGEISIKNRELSFTQKVLEKWI